jgi:3-deoxy-D-manno-octulosonic-acid transferase
MNTLSKMVSSLIVVVVRLLYNALALPLLSVVMRFMGLFNSKIAERVRGERETWKTLEAWSAKTQPRLWIHAASMGEFEQAKAMIEFLKQMQPNLHIIASFFSPSGFRTQQHYAFADAVVYLPLDTKRNARRFVGLLKPDVVVIIRYDVWMNMMETLAQCQIPTLLVAATLNTSSFALTNSVVRELMRQIYSRFTIIYTAGENETAHFERLLQNGQHSVSPVRLVTAADTRFDRIVQQVHAARRTATPLVPDGWFQPEEVVLVLGSSWAADEAIVLPAVAAWNAYVSKVPANAPVHLPCVRLIIVPHEPTPETVSRVQADIRRVLYGNRNTYHHTTHGTNAAPSPITLSAIERGEWTASDKGSDIVVDSVGKLLRLYALADLAYIGGGFGAGVHSVTEPAGYGIPLACGSRIERARDAIALQERGALTVLHNVEECRVWLTTLLERPDERAKRGSIAQNYVQRGLGWSERIAHEIVHIIRQIE